MSRERVLVKPTDSEAHDYEQPGLGSPKTCLAY
eukprot:CAMPEP_0115635008 /NCGR_PEP_ID=MMETSP0272-20121206/32888_1 /TAXON_ID=71861 /ORGANISM="Scrippsiella trochoidea, Strain CCMP3099" /LENGTH=32 /DNA_ID= /DNA_START= /DNA_END= /DNA_ORIENTATION=